jgi:hypothetical protein
MKHGHPQKGIKSCTLFSWFFQFEIQLLINSWVVTNWDLCNFFSVFVCVEEEIAKWEQSVDGMFSGKHEIIVVCLSRQLTSQVGSFAPPSAEIFPPCFLYIVQREFNIQAQPCFLHLSGKYSSSSHVSNIEVGFDHLLHTVWNLIIHLNPDVPLLTFNTHPTFPFSVIGQLYWDPYETLEAPSKAIHRDAFGSSSLWWAHHLLSGQWEWRLSWKHGIYNLPCNQLWEWSLLNETLNNFYNQWCVLLQQHPKLGTRCHGNNIFWQLYLTRENLRKLHDVLWRPSVCVWKLLEGAYVGRRHPVF